MVRARRLIEALVLIGVFHSGIYAQNNFVYTYNREANSVSGFSMGTNGLLTQIAGSPFPTGAMGHQGAFVSATPVGLVRAKNYMYIANAADPGSITGFNIDSASGSLSPITGSPFPGDLNTQSAVATSPDGQFLFQGFLQSNGFTGGGQSTISVFRIAADGVLIPVSGSPFVIPGGLFHIQVSPNGEFLAVAQWFSRAIAIYRIGSDGKLTRTQGSPFPVKDFGLAIKLSFSCDTKLLYVLEADSSHVEILSINADGALKLISEIPLVGLGGNPSDLLLTPNNQFLFSSDLDGNGFHAFRVGPDGTFSKVPGSPFANSGGKQPNLLAVNQAGTFLYVANLSNAITAFKIGADGILANVPGSPFSIGEEATPLFIAAYPLGNCDIRVTSVDARGKKLFVSGDNFDNGATILINGKEQNTLNDDEHWTSVLIGKKAGKKIDVGQIVTIQVRNSNGRLSQEFSFQRMD